MSLADTVYICRGYDADSCLPQFVERLKRFREWESDSKMIDTEPIKMKKPKNISGREHHKLKLDTAKVNK